MMKPITALLFLMVLFTGCTSSSYPFDQVDTEFTFTYDLPENGVVNIVVLNCYMINVRTLLTNNYQTAGNYSLTWNLQDEDGKRVPDGLYYIRIILEGNIIDTKLYEVY